MSTVRDTTAHALISSLSTSADPHGVRLRDHSDWLSVHLAGSRSSVGTTWTGLSEGHSAGEPTFVSPAGTASVTFQSSNGGDTRSFIAYYTTSTGVRDATAVTALVAGSKVLAIGDVQSIELVTLDSLAGAGTLSVHVTGTATDVFTGVDVTRTSSDRLAYTVMPSKQLFPVSLSVHCTLATEFRVLLQAPTQTSEWFQGTVLGSATFDLRGLASAPAGSSVTVDALQAGLAGPAAFTMHAIEGPA